MLHRMMSVLFLTSLLWVLLSPTPVFSQTAETTKYPSRPITLIVPFSAGGSTDLAVRLIAKEAEKALGQPIVVVNKPGGGGSVGVAAVAVAKPDGYTIGQSPGGAPLFILPFLEKIPYNPLKDLRFVMQFIDQDFGILVKGDSPFKGLKEVFEYGRQNPGKLTYGTNAPNSISNLIIEQIAKKERVQTKHIPFKSSPEFQAAVLGGHIVFCAGDYNFSLVESGQTRLVGLLSNRLTTTQGSPPTLKDMGYDIPCPVFLGILGPKALPDDIVKRLDDAFAGAMRQPAFVNGMKELRLTPVYRNNKEFSEYVTHNYEVFGKLLKELGLSK
jgi:tripartite-type tricarboxylate transporter receptor subunit TctC